MKIYFISYVNLSSSQAEILELLLIEETAIKKDLLKPSIYNWNELNLESIFNHTFAIARPT
jgi:hypothetical protein